MKSNDDVLSEDEVNSNNKKWNFIDDNNNK